MGTLVDNGGCYFNGEIILPAPEVMVMKDELAELRAFKATTTPAATTGAAHLGKRARVQQDRLPEIARFRGAARCFYYFQFRGEGETVRELPVSNRAGQEIFINTMSVARSRASAKQEPSKSKCKSNEPSRVTSQAHQQVSARMHRAKVAQSCAAQKGANPPKRKVSEQSKDAVREQQYAPHKCSNENVATKKQVAKDMPARFPPKTRYKLATRRATSVPQDALRACHKTRYEHATRRATCAQSTRFVYKDALRRARIRRSSRYGRVTRLFTTRASYPTLFKTRGSFKALFTTRASYQALFTIRGS